MDSVTVIAAAGRADAGAFLTRLLRFNPHALVRLRPVPPAETLPAGTVQMWAMLPFGVLVVRRVAAPVQTDTTVSGADLLLTLSNETAAPIRRRDEAWRWPLPPSPGVVIERVPAAEIDAIAAAAERTLRTASTEGVGGRVVGERMLRDALLDHVAIVATGPVGERVEVPQRLVQALVRMGFNRSIDDHVPIGETSVTVRVAADWTGLAGSYGTAWYRPISPLRFA
jgi:hypothetical protein